MDKDTAAYSLEGNMTAREKLLLFLLIDTAALMGGYLLGIAHAIDGILS